MMNNQVRLNKAMSILGICSRRDADKLILEEKVSVNNKLISKVGTKISENDTLFINGKNYLFKSQHKEKIWIYYKPVGFVTSHSDEKGRKTVFDDLKNKIKGRVISVGRLDLNSEGLLLLTNSGNFSRFAESPKTGWERHYRVRVFGDLNKNVIENLEKGIEFEGIKYSPIKIISIKQSEGKNCWIECVLTEGKNREIRKIFAHFNILVNKLIRYKYGPYDLDGLNPGEVRISNLPKEYVDS